ncbi:fatty acid desaturase [Coraliomargarita sp. SDUM461004]|uniref:Fatty acid desaturase n=1 Tax=Thalassobacterium sedimentorum TaxID=3041258 RepID=A0ABU1AJT8_9BACT|nr:fatty acid desaturase [Coraliomargarita sp. SDUM461004]MDQ8195084.1 fatty acid desaturase [Coraliomargarita sp. SDUM461004]
MRTGKTLILATREFAKDNTAQSWAHILSTILYMLVVAAIIIWLPMWYLRLPASVLLGLLMVRMFVIYHDHQHHAILPHSKLAKWLMRLGGILAMTPSCIWQHSHNHHHNHNSKLRSTHIGSYPVMTSERYKNSTKKERLKYLLMRHPVTILCGYFTVFILGMCIIPMLDNLKANRDSLIALLVHALLYTLVISALGWTLAAFTIFIPFFTAGAIGSYLFYAQHNFPQVIFKDKEGWSYEGAALDSSSFCKMGTVMNFMTGNIGYHHIHHLNAKIPFYRLPEVYAKLPELQTPRITTLHPKEILRCLSLKVWDVEQQRLLPLKVAFPSDSAK